MTTENTNLIPIEASRPTFSWIQEAGAYQETGLTFNQIQIGAYKAGGIIKISEELLNDSAIDIEGYVKRKMVDGLGLLEEEAFLRGDGVNKPTVYNDPNIQESVAKFYKERFWDAIRLGELNSQKKADEIFIFGVNVGCKIAIKTAQRVAGVVDDGHMGEQSIAAINRIDETKFDKEFDRLEIAYYDRLIEKNPNFRIYARGWRNRALAV